MAYFNFLFALITFAFIISSGIHIYSRGFLLSRSVQTEKRNCDKFVITLNGIQCLSNDKKTCSGENLLEIVAKKVNSTAGDICFEPKSKVVMIVIDALKYEFGIYDENITDPLAYQNKLPIIHELMNKHPDRTRLLKFLADPPTTTLQRLKGITTGSLPTFVDMGSNFATPEINEDNVIDQIFANNLTAVFLGDSTWTELFPKRFKRKYSYSSFNIHDLDTVDAEILKHLPSELKKSDWDLLVAHFLGVDHCGHKHGPLHREMSRKLSEMNEVIKQLAQSIDENTMLLVLGDHGMTISGDHGGASEDETGALLFAYSKQKPFVSTKYDEDISFIQQIDFSPTLAIILGVPIPFSNLGTVSLQLLPDVSVDGLQRHQLLLAHLWHNARQINEYFTKYSEENDKTFSYDVLDEFETKFEVLEHRVNSIYTEDAFMSFMGDLRIQLDNLLELCRNVWIKFNPQLMTQGMLVTFLGIFISFILVFSIPVNKFPQVFNGKIIKFSVTTSVTAAAVGYFKNELLGWDDEVICALFVTSVWNVVIFGYVILANWTIIAEQMHLVKLFMNIVPRFSFICSILVFFSNSFIINEQQILSFLLSAQIIYALYELRTTTGAFDIKGKIKFSSIIKSTFFKVIVVSSGILLLIRASHIYFICREEQGDCWQASYKIDDDKMDLVPVVVLALFVTLFRILLKASGNLTGFAPHVLVAKFGLIISVVAACGHLVLQQLSKKHGTRALIPQIHVDSLAWIVYGALAIEIFMIFSSPLLLHLIRRTESVNVSNYENVIPELFKQVKNIFNKGLVPGEIPIIYGLATVYSSVFIVFGTFLGIVLAMLLGFKALNGFVIVVAISFGILFISSILRHESSKDLKDCMQPQFSLIVSWFLLVNFGFYSTSHQPTISQIDWNAAFVGQTANFDHSSVLSAALVILSTFSSNFFFLAIYPLVLLFPFMIYALYPHLSMMNKKSRDEKSTEYRKVTLSPEEGSFEESDRTEFDVTRGEINLFENETFLMSSAFKVGCQLMILQGIKILASMIACTILCRHLMVWKIFAPRLIYEGIGSYISFIAIIIGFVVLMRVHVSVKALVDKINKKS